MRDRADDRIQIELEISFASINNSFLQSFLSVFLLFLWITATINSGSRSLPSMPGLEWAARQRLLGSEAWVTSSPAKLSSVCLLLWGRTGIGGCIRSEVWRGSHWAKIKVLGAACPSGGSRGKFVFFPFLVSIGHSHFLAVAFSSIIKASDVSQGIFHCTSFSDPLLLPSSTCEDACDYLGPTWIL